MDLSPADRLSLAPTIAKYNRNTTVEFEAVIQRINHAGLGSLSLHDMVAFTLCLCIVPKEGLGTNKGHHSETAASK